MYERESWRRDRRDQLPSHTVKRRKTLLNVRVSRRSISISLSLSLSLSRERERERERERGMHAHIVSCLIL